MAGNCIFEYIKLLMVEVEIMQLANKIVPGSLGLMDFAAGMVAWTLSFTCPIGKSFFF